MMLFLLLMTFLISDEQLEKLNKIHDYFEQTEYSDCAGIITALTILESGWYKSPVHNEFNNYFSYKEFMKSRRDKRCKDKAIYCMRKYKNLDNSLKDMYNFFRRQKYPTDFKGFIHSMQKTKNTQKKFFRCF